MRENSASSHESETKRTHSRDKRSLSREAPAQKKAPPTNIFKRRDSSRERSNSKSKIAKAPEKKLPEKKAKNPVRGRTLQQPDRQRTASSMARLSELCPEDKAKIGELVKKLADETK